VTQPHGVGLGRRHPASGSSQGRTAVAQGRNPTGEAKKPPADVPWQVIYARVMMRDAIGPTPQAEARLSRSELFHELARIHRRSSLRPGPEAGEMKAHGNGAREPRSPKVPPWVVRKIPIGV
jgi:hypothetical protein